MVIEGLSKSRFWNEMAVFVTEDDAQGGVAAALAEPDSAELHQRPTEFAPEVGTQLFTSDEGMLLRLAP